MTSLAKEIVRWIAIVTCGGYGLWQLIHAGRRAVGMRWSGNWSDILGFVVVLMPLLVAAPSLAVSYICLRRQYRKLFVVIGMVGYIVVFAELSALPEQLGMFQFMDRHIHENHDYSFLGLPFALLVIFGPIYAAAWFYRLCLRLAYPDRPRTKTRVTRWLIWLGLFCIIAPPMIGMLVMFNMAAQSSNAGVSSASIRWTIGMSLVGTLLMFLGLVRRQPVATSESDNPTVETSTSVS